MGAVRSRLRRWHVWLGWLVGLPMLFWTVSGLVMVAKPIEEVRGERPDRRPPSRSSCRPAGRAAGRGPAGRSSITLDAARRRTALGDRLRRRRHAPRRSRDRQAAATPRRGRCGPRSDGPLHRQCQGGRNQPGRCRRPAARAAPGDGRLARPDERRHPFLRRWRIGRDRRPAHRLVAVLRLHVGPAHHGPAGPRGHQQPVGRDLRRAVARHGAAGADAAADDHRRRRQRQRPATARAVSSS